MSSKYDYVPDTEISSLTSSSTPAARLVVFGVGGGGGNAVNAMIRAEVEGVEFFVGNTDIQALERSICTNKIQLGKELTKGRGAGGKPSRGCDSAIESEKEIQEVLDRADMLFITAGMGGGTGTGGAPVIARLAKERNILTVGVVTKPFLFEGRSRIRKAEEGIEKLKQYADCLLVIPNPKIIEISGENTTYLEAMALSDKVLLDAVNALISVINSPADVNLDFADVETVFENKGLAIIGIGRASGDNFAVEAAKRAMFSPLLEDSSIEHSSSAIVCLCCSGEMKIHELNKAMDLITSTFIDPDIDILWGQKIDDNIDENSLEVIVIATGYENKVSSVTPEIESPHVVAGTPLDPRSRSAGAYAAVIPPVATPPVTPPIRNSQQMRKSIATLRESQHSLAAAQEAPKPPRAVSRFVRSTNSGQKRRLTDSNFGVTPDCDLSEPSFTRRRNNPPPEIRPIDENENGNN